jgi:hypothetical protein
MCQLQEIGHSILSPVLEPFDQDNTSSYNSAKVFKIEVPQEIESAFLRFCMQGAE